MLLGKAEHSHDDRRHYSFARTTLRVQATLAQLGLRATPRQGPCGGARAGAGGSLHALFGTFVREDMARIKAAMPLISSVDAFMAALQNVRWPRALCRAGLVAGRCMPRRMGLRGA